MKALMKVAKGIGNIEIRDIPLPKIPADDWVLIKIKAAGVCSTDLHIYHDKFRYWPPVVLGHEFSGEIAEVGDRAKNRFKPGDRVVAEPKNEACGFCDVCRQGKIQLCESRRAPGWGVDGAFTDYIIMPAVLVHKMPEDLSFELAALTEPMAIAIHEVAERGKIECQDFVRAYEPDGLTKDEFITFGVTQKTLTQFVETGWYPLQTYGCKSIQPRWK